MTHQSRTILRGRDAVCAYLSGMNIKTVKVLVSQGMPVRTVSGQWYAHADNIEEWFRRWTRTAAGDIDAEETEEN